MALGVRLAETEKELRAIYKFRYRVYVTEFGFNPIEANHKDRTLKDHLDDVSQVFAVFNDDEVVGSLRMLYFSDAKDIEPLIKKYNCQPAVDAFGPEAICATSRFMLDPNLRAPNFNAGRIVYELMAECYREGCKRDIRFNFGDCSPHMLPFYEQMGYRRYTQAYNDTSYGYKLPIMMLAHDRERLDRVRSPIGKLAREYDDDPEIRQWFSDTYTDYRDLESAAFLSEDVFFDILSARVGTDPLHSLSLLRDMTREEADCVLKMGTLIKCVDGDRIIRQGERDNTLYVMLSGIAEITLTQTPDKPVAILAAGDTFGEVGLVAETPRTANVIARSDCEVLVISGEFLQACIHKEPTIAAKLLVNLSRVLAARLSITTAQLANEMV